MKKPIALIFGHRGAVGSAVRETFLKKGYRIIPVDRSIIDFDKNNSDQLISSLLTNVLPDVIVNCAGVIEKGYTISHVKTMNVNVGSNWSILRHYMNPTNQNHPIKIFMIGSSNHTTDQQLHPIYSASKSALHSLWQSVRDALDNTSINIYLINPKITSDNVQLTQIGNEIIKLVDENSPSKCVDINFKEHK
jgi:short-subunit dehydrogenase